VFYQGDADGDQQMYWSHDGVIFAAGRTSYSDNKRMQTNDVGSYDVVIESATETDQGLYQCQALPSGFRDTTYLWVDGNAHYRNIYSTLSTV